MWARSQSLRASAHPRRDFDAVVSNDLAAAQSRGAARGGERKGEGVDGRKKCLMERVGEERGRLRLCEGTVLREIDEEGRKGLREGKRVRI